MNSTETELHTAAAINTARRAFWNLPGGSAASRKFDFGSRTDDAAKALTAAADAITAYGEEMQSLFDRLNVEQAELRELRAQRAAVRAFLGTAPAVTE